MQSVLNELPVEVTVCNGELGHIIARVKRVTNEDGRSAISDSNRYFSLCYHCVRVIFGDSHILSNADANLLHERKAAGACN